MCCVPLPLQLTDSSAQIRSYVFDVVRASVPNIILDDVFTVSRSKKTAKIDLSVCATQLSGPASAAPCGSKAYGTAVSARQTLWQGGLWPPLASPLQHPVMLC